MLVVAAGCRVASIDYTGKQCPCPSGYSCDQASATCVRGDASGAMPCPANGFFCDGFESGDVSRWSTTDLSPGVALTTETTTVHSGQFALDANVQAMTTSGAIAAAVEQFPLLATGMFAARAWVYLPQPLINFDSVMTMAQGPHVLTVDGDNTGYWTVTEHAPSVNPPDHHSTTLSVTNTWTCVEIDYEFADAGGAAVISLYIANSVVLAVAAGDPDASFDEARVGVSRADMAGDVAIVDDVVLATQHVGCE